MSCNQGIWARWGGDEGWALKPLITLAGHRGSAAARVSKLFQTEHGEPFNVSSSSEWVQGEAPEVGGRDSQEPRSLQSQYLLPVPAVSLDGGVSVTDFQAEVIVMHEATLGTNPKGMPPNS